MRFVLILLLIIASSANAGYYNTNTLHRVDSLPNPLIINGQSLFNPRWPDYAAAGWLRLQSDTVPYAHRVTVTNYIVDAPTIISVTNGITNVVVRPGLIVRESFVLEPVVVEKSTIVQAAEAQYVGTWHALFGPENTGYTNADYDAVAIAVVQIAQTNPAVLAATHTMERSFLIVRDWWTAATERAVFHPYPWGVTNVVIKDIVGSDP